MQVLGSDGARIAVRVDGAGDAAVVLLHGFPLTKAIWRELIPRLASSQRVVAIDLRGMGASEVTGGPYLMESLAGDVAAVLDALGIERAALIGHSLGGYVALAFARMYCERLERLALVCSRLAADTQAVARSRLALADVAERDASAQEIIDAYVPRLISQSARRERPELPAEVEAIARTNDVCGLSAMLRGMAVRDGANDIAPDLTMPVLTICGGQDELLTLETATADASVFPNAALCVMERSGHLPMLEEPGAFADRLVEFLRR